MYGFARPLKLGPARVLMLAALVLMLGASGALAQRQFFLIATGPSSGTYFPVGEAIAALISHPPGLHRCAVVGVCGPEGLIASARTSAGALANVADVNARRVNSGLAQADVVADAVAGKGPFRKLGPQREIRIIADLFPEEVHLVALKSAHITSVASLRGKTVSLGDAQSGTAVTARSVLAAWGIAPWRLREKNMPSDAAAQALRQGHIDAFFFVGGAPVGLVSDLLASGKAVLVPIDGKGRARLLAMVPFLRAATLPAGTYSQTGAIKTVSVPALWVVNAKEPDDVVYSVTRALFNPANRAALDASRPAAKQIRLDAATTLLPAPLHPGAQRFYRQVGKLPPIPVPQLPPADRT